MALGRLVDGYTYWLRVHGSAERKRRHLSPIVTSALPMYGRTSALSFHELMELRVVKSIVERGVTLRHARAAASLAASTFKTDHPFASRRVFSDGRNIFSALSDEQISPNLVKWAPHEIDQVIAGPIFEQYMLEIEFDAKTALAQRWWPRGRSVPIVLDPSIGFGAPIVSGTGVKTASIASVARASSIEEAAVAYEIDIESATAAVKFERALAAA